jgi:hypothetical protein
MVRVSTSLIRIDRMAIPTATNLSLNSTSAFGPQRTLTCAAPMSAFGGKADMTLCGNPLLRSLLGEKRTSLFAAQMSANDPKRTCGDIQYASLSRYYAFS